MVCVWVVMLFVNRVVSSSVGDIRVMCIEKFFICCCLLFWVGLV